jgi:hypothetical protein
MYEELDHLRRYSELDDRTLLICLGAAKCGTSWLHHYLGGLPEVTVSPLKELHFFDGKFSGLSLGDMDGLAVKRVGFHIEQPSDPVEYLRASDLFQASIDRAQMIYDDNAYFGHFARLCAPQTKVLCDITPGYSVIGLNGFHYLKAFCARQDMRLKLLYVMRDPVERFWSQLRHLQEMNPESRIVENWEKALESPRVCARADYEGTVSDLDTVFASEDVLYLFYEDLFSDVSLRRLCAFLEVGYQPGETSVRQNRTTLDLDLPDKAREAFARLLAPQYAFCRTRFGEAVPAQWRPADP